MLKGRHCKAWCSSILFLEWDDGRHQWIRMTSSLTVNDHEKKRRKEVVLQEVLSIRDDALAYSRWSSQHVLYPFFWGHFLFILSWDDVTLRRYFLRDERVLLRNDHALFLSVYYKRIKKNMTLSSFSRGFEGMIQKRRALRGIDARNTWHGERHLSLADIYHVNLM